LPQIVTTELNETADPPLPAFATAVNCGVLGGTIEPGFVCPVTPNWPGVYGLAPCHQSASGPANSYL
jgi:hypothetical protein